MDRRPGQAVVRGLRPEDIDLFAPYDGFAVFTQYSLEAFGWRGVKRGEAHDFYAGDITLEGPNPINSGGGNMGTGRMRTVFITDPLEQLQGRAGPRQVSINAEVAVTIGVLPGNAAALAFSTSPDETSLNIGPERAFAVRISFTNNTALGDTHLTYALAGAC